MNIAFYSFQHRRSSLSNSICCTFLSVVPWIASAVWTLPCSMISRQCDLYMPVRPLPIGRLVTIYTPVCGFFGSWAHDFMLPMFCLMCSCWSSTSCCRVLGLAISFNSIQAHAYQPCEDISVVMELAYACKDCWKLKSSEIQMQQRSSLRFHTSSWRLFPSHQANLWENLAIGLLLYTLPVSDSCCCWELGASRSQDKKIHCKPLCCTMPRCRFKARGKCHAQGFQCTTRHTLCIARCAGRSKQRKPLLDPKLLCFIHACLHQYCTCLTFRGLYLSILLEPWHPQAKLRADKASVSHLDIGSNNPPATLTCTRHPRLEYHSTGEPCTSSGGWV